MCMLPCQPPATAIDLNFYNRRRRHAQHGGHITVRIQRLNGVRLEDVVEALEGEVSQRSFAGLRVLVEPLGLQSLFGALKPVLSRHIQRTETQHSCSAAMREIKSQLGALQTLVERLQAEVRSNPVATQ